VGSWRVQFAETSFSKIFEGFGGFGILVERPGEIQDALKEAFDSGKPAIVDIITEPSARSRMGAL
jgi:thiamine pyrophosphate-dependent acetolactate synthase large subunit-like protein